MWDINCLITSSRSIWWRTPSALGYSPKRKPSKTSTYKSVCWKAARWSRKTTPWFLSTRSRHILICWRCWSFCPKMIDSLILPAAPCWGWLCRRQHRSPWEASVKFGCSLWTSRNSSMPTGWTSLPCLPCGRSLNDWKPWTSRPTIRWWTTSESICWSAVCRMRSIPIWKITTFSSSVRFNRRFMITMPPTHPSMTRSASWRSAVSMTWFPPTWRIRKSVS